MHLSVVMADILFAWKDSSPNDLLCVEWDVKPYTLNSLSTQIII